MLEASVLGYHPPKSLPKSRSSTVTHIATATKSSILEIVIICDQYREKGMQKVRWCRSKNILQKQGGRKNTLVQVEKNFWLFMSASNFQFSLFKFICFDVVQQLDWSTDFQV